jgi:hypothetical protein
MIEIPLGDGSVATVDDQDGELVAGYQWKPFRVRGRTYARAWHRELKQYVSLHRLVVFGPLLIALCDGRDEVDHIDGDGLKCVRRNLRYGGHENNMRNRRKRSGTTSEFIGVSRVQSKNCWRAQIQVNGRSISLGSFNDEKSAAEAYNTAAHEHFGEWAKLNNLDECQR